MKPARWMIGNSAAGRTGSFALVAAVAASLLAHSIAGTAQRAAFRSYELSYLHGGVANHVSPGYLGVDIRDLSDEQIAALKSAQNPNQPHGAEILHIDHDGPAFKAGLRERDVVLVMNGQPIEAGEPLRRMLRETPPGRTVTLIVSRDGKQQTIAAVMSTREDVEREAWDHHYAVVDPQPAPAAAAPAPDDHPGSGFFSRPTRASRNFLGSIVLSPGYTGAMLETMAPQLAEFFGAQGKSGLLVRSVDANSPAAAAGMRAGDVVVRVNTTSIAASSDWLRVVRDNKGKSMAVVVLRDRREQTLTLTPNAKHHSSLLPDLWPFNNGAKSFVKPASAPQELCSTSPSLFMM